MRLDRIEAAKRRPQRNASDGFLCQRSVEHTLGAELLTQSQGGSERPLVIIHSLPEDDGEMATAKAKAMAPAFLAVRRN